MKPSGELVLEQKQSRRLGVDVREASRKPRGREAHPTPWARPPPSWDPRGSPDRLLSPIYVHIPWNIKEQNRSGVPPPEVSVATENQSRPVPVPCRRGQSLSSGHLHHPGALHDDEGVVLPRGWGYVPVAMCLISLSLSSVLEVVLSWCIASFAIIVGCYDVSPPLLSCNGLSFPLKLSYRIESLRIWEHLMYVLHVLICADNGIFTWFTWCMFWWSTCGFRPWTYA